MATLLVYARNDPDDPSWDTDTIASRQRRGHIIHVAGNRHRWGKRESFAQWVREGEDPALWPAKNVLIRVPPLRVVDARKLLGPATTLTLDPRVINKVLKKFQWRISFKALPANKRTELRATHETTLTMRQFRRAADHNITRAFFSENNPKGQGRKRTLAERSADDD